MNAKAMSVIELYGILDPVTRDWTDGVLSNIFREMNKPTEKKERRYVLFDGDVDALWIENMNSVMDDNKLLTLANGERIRLQPHCAMLFEVGDLQYASPATVSRAGMVYVDPKNLRYAPYWQRWLSGRASKLEKEKLQELYEKSVDPLIDLIHEGILDGKQGDKLKLIVPQTDLNMVTQLCQLLESRLDFIEKLTDPQILEAIFIECFYWSLGGTLMEESQEQFNTLATKLFALPKMSDSDDSFAPPGMLPSRYPLLYDYHFETDKNQWIPWRLLVPEYVHDPERPFHEILVPTIDTTRTTWLLTIQAAIKRPVVLVGESGTSKSATIQDFLRNLDHEKNLLLNINFSSRTSSMDVQRTLEANIEKRTKEIYGPPPGKRLVVFMDDMNMPQVDTYGTQQPIALMKLLLEKGGIYDRAKDLNYKTLKDISYVAAMGKAGGGRNSTDPRFLSLFSVFNMAFPSDESVHKIYTSILSGHLQPFDDVVTALAPAITSATLDLYKKIVRDLPPTPSKFHYIFNLRDLSRIYNGLCITSAERFPSKETFVRVWRNECLRVFHDRLINGKDKKYLQESVNSLINQNFSDTSQHALRDPILYGDYRNMLQPNEPRLYEDIQDFDAAKGLFAEILQDYNEKNTAMNLVLFDDALDHLTRVHRVLRVKRGHSLLVGVGGSGKQSLAKLASYAAGCEIFEISLSRGYDETNFREDLKVLYHKLGIENGGRKISFLFTDSHVAEEGFLELINNMLTTGAVPALFADDEKDGNFSKPKYFKTQFF